MTSLHSKSAKKSKKLSTSHWAEMQEADQNREGSNEPADALDFWDFGVHKTKKAPAPAPPLLESQEGEYLVVEGACSKEQDETQFRHPDGTQRRWLETPEDMLPIEAAAVETGYELVKEDYDDGRLAKKTGYDRWRPLNGWNFVQPGNTDPWRHVSLEGSNTIWLCNKHNGDEVIGEKYHYSPQTTLWYGAKSGNGAWWAGTCMVNKSTKKTYDISKIAVGLGVDIKIIPDWSHYKPRFKMVPRTACLDPSRYPEEPTNRQYTSLGDEYAFTRDNIEYAKKQAADEWIWDETWLLANYK